MTNELVEVEEVAGAELVEVAETEEVGNLIASTFGHSIEESKEAYNLVNNAIYLHDGLLDTPLKVKNVLLERGERTSRETGKKVPCVNSYIVTTDGGTYFTQSSGIARGLATIYRLVPTFRDENGEPLTIVIRAREMNNGNVLKVVEWV